MGQKRLRVMDERNGTNVCNPFVVSIDSDESFLLSALGSRIRTQTCFSIGMSHGSSDLEVI